MNRTAELYQTVAMEFAERVVRELDGEIQAIVLYGSVDRGQATAKSDIDILVVARHGDSISAISDAKHGDLSRGSYRPEKVSVAASPQAKAMG